MEEIEVKRNPLGIKVFVVGKPDIDHMTEDEYGLFVSSLEMRMNEYLEKTRKQVRHTDGTERATKRLT